MNITTDIWSEPDFEKRKLLWAFYLQQVDRSIKNLTLSPKYKEVKNNKSELHNLVSFMRLLKDKGQDLVGIDFSKLKLIYNAKSQDDALIYRLDEIENEFIPAIEKRYFEYSQLKDFLYDVISIETIGIENIYSKEGYLFLKHKRASKVYTYSYFISNYVNKNKRSLVKIKRINEFRYRIGSNLLNHKQQLNKQHNYHLNCYLLESEVDLPFESTFLPIAKGKLSRYLMSA